MIISRIYENTIRKHKDAISFIILFFFITTFIVSRVFIYLNTVDIIPDSLMLNRNIRGVHIHHLSFGIIFLTIAGYFALCFQNPKIKHFIAAFYGIGLGLAYDEFGMWLMLKDNYWVRQSYDAVAVITVFLLNIVYFRSLWQKIFLKFVTLTLKLTHKHLAKIQRQNFSHQKKSE